MTTQQTEQQLNLDDLLKPESPVCLVIQADMKTVGNEDTFQPAGFPQIGHVIYKAPRKDNNGNPAVEDVCIVDSPASMANHLETVCAPYGDGFTLHPDLDGLPHVVCVTDAEGSNELRSVTSTLQEGHRLASDYFVDPTEAKLAKEGKEDDKSKWPLFREQLRQGFGLREIKKNDKYFTYPDSWWSIYKTIFKYDPNSLVHGLLFAKEQIKITRFLTAHMEAFGAGRVRGSGVKFDPLGKTASGQPIFATDSETAHSIRATFILDLALLRSYGRKVKVKDDKDDDMGLSDVQKQLLLKLAFWKMQQLLSKPFRFRSRCYLGCSTLRIFDERYREDKQSKDNESGNDKVDAEESEETRDKSKAAVVGLYKGELPNVNFRTALDECGFTIGKGVTKVWYPSEKLFKAKDETPVSPPDQDVSDAGNDEMPDNEES